MWASPPQIYAKLAARVDIADQGAARGQLLDQQPSAGVAAHLASVSSRVMGLPCSSHTAWGLEFNPLLVRPVQREDPFFPQACGRPFCFEIGASITIRSRPDPSFASQQKSARTRRRLQRTERLYRVLRAILPGRIHATSLATRAFVCGHRDFGRAAQWRGGMPRGLVY